MILVWGKRTPDMPKDLCGSLGQRLKMLLQIGSASRSDSAIEPAIAPVDQAKAIDPPIISRRSDQAFPT